MSYQISDWIFDLFRFSGVSFSFSFSKPYIYLKSSHEMKPSPSLSSVVKACCKKFSLVTSLFLLDAAVKNYKLCTFPLPLTSMHLKTLPHSCCTTFFSFLRILKKSGPTLVIPCSKSFVTK